MGNLDRIPELDRIVEYLSDTTKEDILESDIVSREESGVAVRILYVLCPGSSREKLFWLNEDGNLRNETVGTYDCCMRCHGDRVLSIDAFARDSHHCSLGDKEHDGYAPSVSGVCGGDGVWIELCLDCGQVQSDFPKETPEEFLPDEERDND